MLQELATGLSLALGLTNPFFDVNQFSIYGEQEQIQPEGYMCDQFVWTKPLAYTGSRLKGTITARCEVVGEANVGFEGLRDYYLTEIPKNASKIYAGPTKTTYKTVDATYYDLEVSQKLGTDSIVTRQDVYIATDTVNIFHSDAMSKNIQGTGNADYVKKVDLFSQTTPIALPNPDNKYVVNITAYMEFQKPWFAPGGLFMNEVKKAIEGNIQQVEKSYMETMAAHL